MGGEFGFTIIYLLHVVVGSIGLFIVLGFRSQHSSHARWGLVSGIVSALLLSCFGVLWWYFNYSQDLTIKNVAMFCIAPGFIIGAALYGIVVKAHRLFTGGGYS